MVHAAETVLIPDISVTRPWQRCHRASLWRSFGGADHCSITHSTDAWCHDGHCWPLANPLHHNQCPLILTSAEGPPYLLPPLRTCWACPSRLHWSFHPCRGSFSWGPQEGCCSFACCVSIHVDEGQCLQPEVCTYLGKARGGGEKKRQYLVRKPKRSKCQESFYPQIPNLKQFRLRTAFTSVFQKEIFFPYPLALTKATSQDQTGPIGGNQTSFTKFAPKDFPILWDVLLQRCKTNPTKSQDLQASWGAVWTETHQNRAFLSNVSASCHGNKSPKSPVHLLLPIQHFREIPTAFPRNIMHFHRTPCQANRKRQQRNT